MRRVAFVLLSLLGLAGVCVPAPAPPPDIVGSWRVEKFDTYPSVGVEPFWTATFEFYPSGRWQPIYYCHSDCYEKVYSYDPKFGVLNAEINEVASYGVDDGVFGQVASFSFTVHLRRDDLRRGRAIGFYGETARAWMFGYMRLTRVGGKR
jgi:hypothetical protein